LTDRRADLHIHSTHSDGTLSPEEIVRLAAEARLAAVSVTDHDNVAAVGEATACGEKQGVEVIPGVELSAIEDGSDIHILADRAPEPVQERAEDQGREDGREAQ
jgi:predicted metal-dependent phosphoesterase TrpH